MISGRQEVSKASVGKLFLVMLAAAVSVSVRSSADSISTVYDMNRMLNEPHPMADEYGTRWTPPPISGHGAPPRAPSTPAPRPIAPMPSTSGAMAPVPSTPPPALPPYIPTPVLVPTSAEPAPSPAAAPKPAVNTVTSEVRPMPRPMPSPPKIESAPMAQGPEDVPVLELSPRLSIDTGGLDVDVVKTAPPPPPPVLPDPGK